MAKILLITTAVLAILAGVGAISTVSGASKDTVVVESWRMIGLFTFAALFSILAVKPTIGRSLWLTVILNKLILTITGVVLLAQPNVVGASDLVIFDGGLTVVLLVASFLAGIWKK
jgi:hypothetical protein